jgi:hypothetical protein
VLPTKTVHNCFYSVNRAQQAESFTDFRGSAVISQWGQEIRGGGKFTPQAAAGGERGGSVSSHPKASPVSLGTAMDGERWAICV